jgi:hypothetical protein
MTRFDDGILAMPCSGHQRNLSGFVLPTVSLQNPATFGLVDGRGCLLNR